MGVGVELHQPPWALRIGILPERDRVQVLVVHLALAVGQRLEAREDRIERGLVGRVAEHGQALAQRGAARVLAQHEARVGNAHVLRPHDLVGVAVPEHAVLVDARLVGERVVAHDRLVALHALAGELAEQARGRIQLARVDARVQAKVRAAHLERHHDLLERGVARALADAVDRALDLARAGLDRGQAVGGGQAEVVVAVGREHHRLGAAHVRAQEREALRDLGRRHVADRVGRVERGRARGHHRAEHLGEELRLGAHRVLGRELHLVAQPARAFHRRARGIHHLLARQSELVLAVQRAGRDEHVDARAPGALERARGAVDVAVLAARERAHRGAAQRARDARDRGEIVGRGRGEARFEHVHAQRFQRLRQAQLGRRVHREARRLLAIAQRGVEDAHAPGGGRAGRGSWIGFGVVHRWLRWEAVPKATKNPAPLLVRGSSGGFRFWF